MPSCFKVEDGFDPVGPKYAEGYGSRAWQKDYEEGDVDSTMEGIERRLGTLKNLNVLDLGGGPGQFTVGFALRGALVTWHDPSRAYLTIAQEKAQKYNVRCTWSLGYLEVASRLRDKPFDLVFCRVCWSYCASDKKFADLIISLIKPGGAGWVLVNTAEGVRRRAPQPDLVSKLSWLVYKHTGLKLHYHGPPKRYVSSLFLKQSCVREMETAFLTDGNERIWLRREP